MSLLHGLHLSSRRAIVAQDHHIRPPAATGLIKRPFVSTLLKQQTQSHGSQHSQLQRLQAQQGRAAAAARLHAAAAEEQTMSYEWSWQQKGRSHLPEANSQFDQQHLLPSQPTLQDVQPLLTAAAAACEASAEAAAADAVGITADAQQPADADAAPPTSLPSQAWLQQLLTATQPLLQQAAAPATCEVLSLLARMDYTPDSSWMQDVLAALCARLQELSTQEHAALLWSLSNLRYTPTQQQWQALLAAAQARFEDFYGPDLALLVCAAGSILSTNSSSFDPEGGVRSQPAGVAADGPVAAASGAHDSSSSGVQLELPAGWADAVLAEAQYQIKEFPADLGAFDLARMASGLADLGISPSTELQDRLMKAVYMRTRTIEEKGAVDFALAKLDSKGKKSMHYDPRWTHEELKWLPRRERDKRRLIKEGWYRTQWTGYG